MTILANVILPIFLAAGLAGLVQPYLKLESRTFSRAAFYIFSPALVFHGMVTSNVDGGEFLRIFAGVSVITFVLWGIAELAAHLLRLEEGTRGAFIITILLMNSGNYGFPANLFAFGEAGLARAVVYSTAMTMLRSSLGIYIVARSHASAKQALHSIFTVPLLYTAFAGLVFNLTGWTVPEPVLKATQILGEGAVPALMMVLGMQLAEIIRQKRDLRNLPALATVTCSRLLLAPVLAFLVSWAIGLQGLTRNVMVLESAMPSAVLNLAMTAEYDADPAFATLSVFVTTLASLITVTLWLNWML